MRPAPIVDGMVGLNRGDDIKFGEMFKIFRMNMLCMFKAKSSISFAMQNTSVGEIIQTYK